MDYQLGHEDAIAALFGRYKRPIFNFAYRMLANRADAEDVTGDVFLVLFSKKYTQSPRAKFSTWLFTVARNRCIDKIRKRKNSLSMWFKRNAGDDYEEWDVVDNQDIPREEMERKEIRKVVRKSIDSLPANLKEALILREYQKLSYGEISQVLDCSLENVKVLIYRARERLKVELSSFIEGEE